MHTRAGLGLVAVGLALAAPAGDREFDAVVKGIESHYGVKRTAIPMFGLAKLIVKVGRPEGVKQIDVALFKNVRLDAADAGEIDAMIQRAVAGRWRPLVRVRSRDRESSYIYFREDGRNIRLLVAAFEPGEASVIEVSVPPETLAEWVRDPADLNGRLNGRGDHGHADEY